MKTFKNEIAFQTEGTYVETAIVKVPQDVLENIEKAKLLCFSNDFIESINVNVGSSEIELLDDEDNNMDEEFRIGSDYFMVTYYKSLGDYHVTYRGYSKWDSSYYL